MRVAERITGAIGLERCPECDKWVLPVREACPNCGFPISRFLSRMRWFPRLLVSMMMMVLSGVTFVLLFVPHGELQSWIFFGWALFTAASLTLVVVSAYGVITGGRHTAGQSIQSSAWKAGKRIKLEEEERRAKE